VRLHYFPGDIDLGQAPARATLPVGPGRVTGTLEGHLEQTREVTIREGESVSLALLLQRAADRAASLSVTGQPAGAMVRLGGQEIGRLPLTLAGLDPGPRTLELEAPRHEPWRGDLMLEAGAATRVDAALLRPEDRSWAGWKWLGYGTGGVLAACGGAAAALARSARGDFDASPSSSTRERVGRLNVAADVLLAAGVVTLAATALVHVLSAPRARSRATITVAR
jgi:hypothetical protein